MPWWASNPPNTFPNMRSLVAMLFWPEYAILSGLVRFERPTALPEAARFALRNSPVPNTAFHQSVPALPGMMSASGNLYVLVSTLVQGAGTFFVPQGFGQM